MTMAAALWFVACAGASAPIVATAASPIAWPATDALGRRLPTAAEVGPVRKDRFVGIFYFLTHNSHQPGEARDQGPNDISKILARDPDALIHPASNLWKHPGEYYWGEPLYGYYLSTDPWVLRRHAQLLSAAGIDTLIFDTTNAVTYPEVYNALCQVFADARKAGAATPQIAFMVNTKAGETAGRIYRDLYEPGRFRDLWFMWQGKPLMICDPNDASPQLKQFFTLRAAHWPFTLVNTPYAWHWESTYPQVYGYTEDPAKPEEVNVAVAQNLRAADGRVTNMSLGDARGRSFHDGREDRSPGAIDRGYNFGEQWKRALQLHPPFVMVTGWNEWTAGRFGDAGRVTFVDQYSEEFSRDIEPMKGGHGDNYYYQLVANVRRFKGASPLPKASAARSIQVNGDFAQWREVGPEYTDDSGDTSSRDYDGADGLHYVNNTGRNDLVASKVARDSANIYFYARTQATLTPRTGANWIWLLIDSGKPDQPNWEGYDYIVNRQIDADGSSWLEKSEGGWKWKKVAKIQCRAAGNQLQLAIPRTALGLADKTGGVSINFKWADNLQHPGDVMDFYLSGDVAPEGRFMYRYVAESP
jgi:hypothetical protein